MESYPTSAMVISGTPIGAHTSSSYGVITAVLHDQATCNIVALRRNKMRSEKYSGFKGTLREEANPEDLRPSFSVVIVLLFLSSNFVAI